MATAPLRSLTATHLAHRIRTRSGEGLPLGVQIVGRHREDFALLQLADAFREATGL